MKDLIDDILYLKTLKSELELMKNTEDMRCNIDALINSIYKYLER